MDLKNGVMLITYPDSLGRDLRELRQVLDRYLDGAVAGIHILPFYPSTSDRGFSPMRYDMVEPAYGNWNDVADLSEKYYLMFDFMVNHISSHSVQFQDFLSRKEKSPFRDLFVRYKDFWPEGGPPAQDLEKIYMRKPKAPCVDAKFADGTSEKVWCTFGDDQIDLDIRKGAAWSFVEENLKSLARRGPALIRLDAVAYTTKKPGTPCFFEEPEIWEVLGRARSILAPFGVEILPEVHEKCELQLKMAEQGYRVYDFALPMLLLHALYAGETQNLAQWLRICPRKQFTTLDTHDGIGVVDVRGLLTDEQIEQTREYIFSQAANIKDYSTVAFRNLDLYQINCTYYSALGNDNDAYLTARAVQVFAPGIPQVYYVGLLAGENDIGLVESTNHGRDINRRSYTVEEVARETERPVVQKILKLLRFRNEYPAFDGDCEVSSNGHVLNIERSSGGYKAVLTADMKEHTCSVEYYGSDGDGRELEL